MVAFKTIADRLLNERNNRYFAALSYLPFVGWLLPLYIKRDNDFCQNHAKQGLVLAVLVVGSVIVLSLLDVFLLNEWREIRLSLVLIIYLLHLSYFILCIIGTIWSLKQKELSFPIIDHYIRRMDL